MRHYINKIISCFIAMAIICGLAGCTRNNGDIGDYFGEWRFDKITADGIDMNIYDNPNGVELFTWAFQDNIIRINTIYPHHMTFSSFGTWLQRGDILELNFSYHDDDSENAMYAPPIEMHFDESGITRLHIVSMKNRKMILSRIDTDGTEYMYYLNRPY